MNVCNALLAIVASLALTSCVGTMACDGQPSGNLTALLSDAGASTQEVNEAVTAELLSVPVSQHRCWADSGDQVSQYLMGFGYEHGIGVEPDAELALRYYKRAASPRSNRTYVYSPAVGSESHGRVIPVTAGPDVPGLGAAQKATERLEHKGK